MEISYTHRELGFVRFVNVEHFQVSGRIIVYYVPDIGKYKIEPLANISDLEIEDGYWERDIVFLPKGE